MIIAIDGPTASGKSRLGKNLSDKLKIDFVDSGKLYRIIAYLYKNSNSNLNKFLKSKNWDEEFKRDDFSNDDLYSPEVSDISSKISTNKEVRKIVTDYLRKLAKKNNLIVAGRDIGTVVFKNADLKIFLTAEENEREKRRLKQLLEKGYSDDKIDRELFIRDKRDSRRKIAPLKPAKDAIIIDNTNLKKEETLNIVLNEMKRRGII
ncbi:MAG TPA: (d)CMP kinase [Caldisericia bacterium]|nr:(d)CMP kinase [Caldisericia bacterium]HOL82910.1 (d)CMP kinase [Caldisericia bacterium]HON83153.1 (d)CMP kinase [Caldisericia bacterium]HPP43013.1 (d)CMP kinase [Caldisericia bacterium]HQJ56029.1 (d)CMP kinase [Caldisericia bacterium]